MQPLLDLDLLDDIDAPKLSATETTGTRSVYIETYGCQMNVADSEVVASVLTENGWGLTRDADSADVVLLNTCAIREGAEQKVRRRLADFRADKVKRGRDLQLGVLGCMAERLRAKLLDEEKLVDLVVGPDAYRDLPRLLDSHDETGQAAVNVQLEQGGDVRRFGTDPLRHQRRQRVRVDHARVRQHVRVLRRPVHARARAEPSERVDSGRGEGIGRRRLQGSDRIGAERQQLSQRGERRTGRLRLLCSTASAYSRTICASATRRAIPKTARPTCSTSTPNAPDVCNFIHLPVQHGSTETLKRMRRTYSREQYLRLIEQARAIVPDIAFSTDLIAGFCGETDEEHAQTLSLMEGVRYDHAFMFAYSERPGTYAARKFEDDVPEAVKKERLSQIIRLQNQHSLESNKRDIGTIQTVLAEGASKRSDAQLMGRTDANRVVVFDRDHYAPGDYVAVRIDSASSATLKGVALGKTTMIGEGVMLG